MKRTLSLLMAVILCLSLLPLGALASEEAVEAVTPEPTAEAEENPVIETDVDSEKPLDIFTEEETLPVEEVKLEVNEDTDKSAEIAVGNDSLDFCADGTSVTQAEAVAWAASQVGKSLDYDGYYGAQCVDFIMYYYRFLGVSPVSGNGADYAWNTLPSGWSRIQNAQPQPGDILVYTGTSSNPYGHVGIYASTCDILPRR